MRLVGGSNSQGRLEVLHDGIWGTVCGDFFSEAAARVVCNMLVSGYCPVVYIFGINVQQFSSHKSPGVTHHMDAVSEETGSFSYTLITLTPMLPHI